MKLVVPKFDPIFLDLMSTGLSFSCWCVWTHLRMQWFHLYSVFAVELKYFYIFSVNSCSGIVSVIIFGKGYNIFCCYTKIIINFVPCRDKVFRSFWSRSTTYGGPVETYIWTLHGLCFEKSFLRNGDANSVWAFRYQLGTSSTEGPSCLAGSIEQTILFLENIND